MASQDETVVDAAAAAVGVTRGEEDENEDDSSSSTQFLVPLNPGLSPRGLTRRNQALRSLFFLMNDDDFEEEVEIELYRRLRDNNKRNNDVPIVTKQWISLSEHERKVKQALEEQCKSMAAASNVSGSTLSNSSSNSQVSSPTALVAGELDIIQNCHGGSCSSGRPETAAASTTSAATTAPTKKNPLKDSRNSNGGNCENLKKKKRNAHEMEQVSHHHHHESSSSSSSSPSSQQENHHGLVSNRATATTTIGKSSSSSSSNGTTTESHIPKKKHCTTTTSSSPAAAAAAANISPPRLKIMAVNKEQPRGGGKPQAMTLALAAALRIQAARKKLQDDDDDAFAASAVSAAVDDANDNDDDLKDDDDKDDDFNTGTTGSRLFKNNIGMKEPRGKHEAMALALAATRVQTARQELEEEACAAAAAVGNHDNVNNNNNNNNHGDGVVAESDMKERQEPAAAKTTDTSSATTSKRLTVCKKSPSSKNASSTSKASSSSSPAAKQKSSKSSSLSSSSKASAAPCSSPINDDSNHHHHLHHHRTELLLHEPTQPITKAEYENLEALMIQFCRVPLLAEFSRPVARLHPELASSYAKIVKRPMDLGHVCRGIRRRSYKKTRDVRLDIWRVFANCVTFNAYGGENGSFGSIALHLLEYFNCLWQEYMLPSDMPPSEHSPSSSSAANIHRHAHIKRNHDRTKRLESCSTMIVTQKFISKVSDLVAYFLENGGRIDALDQDEILSPQETEGDPGVQNVISNLKSYRDDLLRMSTDTAKYNVEGLVSSLRTCCTHGRNGDSLLEDNPALRSCIANRLDRLIGQLLVPLYEANSRGVMQSSIWGNIYTTVWARDSGKHAFWPALCLGILAPEDQRQDWHLWLTERNESRLPQKQRTQLATAKEKCERAQKRNEGRSFFLIEFLGSHQFGWVRDTDIVQKFDTEENPNEQAIKGNRGFSRSSIANIMNSKMYTTGIEECKWATKEFEQVLQEAFDFDEDDDTGDDELMSYSYSLLNQPDDEADEEDTQHGYEYDVAQMSASDIDEATWLIENEGSKPPVGSQGRKH